jgi:hypothetical protein
MTSFVPLLWSARLSSGRTRSSVLGRPFFQLVDPDVVAATGEYKSSALVTAGSNVCERDSGSR